MWIVSKGWMPDLGFHPYLCSVQWWSAVLHGIFGMN